MLPLSFVLFTFDYFQRNIENQITPHHNTPCFLGNPLCPCLTQNHVPAPRPGRILRKGCGGDCTIRHCLQWIKPPQSQASATLFLAKFYGRAGLVNLINAAPKDLRPSLFKSLLYDVCGRIVNPIHVAVGLMSSVGRWDLCQAAVEAVLRGEPVAPFSSESTVLLQAGGIRHISKDESSPALAVSSDDKLLKVKSRRRFKRSGPRKPKQFTESTRSRDSELLAQRDSLGEADSASVESVEPSLMKADEKAHGSDVELELTLGSGSGPGNLSSSICSAVTWQCEWLTVIWCGQVQCFRKF